MKGKGTTVATSVRTFLVHLSASAGLAIPWTVMALTVQVGVAAMLLQCWCNAVCWLVLHNVRTSKAMTKFLDAYVYVCV